MKSLPFSVANSVIPSIHLRSASCAVKLRSSRASRLLDGRWRLSQAASSDVDQPQIRSPAIGQATRFRQTVFSNSTSCIHGAPITPLLSHSPVCLSPDGYSLSTWAWLAILSGVIADGRNFQAMADQSYQVLVAVALNHRVPLDDSLA